MYSRPRRIRSRAAHTALQYDTFEKNCSSAVHHSMVSTGLPTRGNGAVDRQRQN